MFGTYEQLVERFEGTTRMRALRARFPKVKDDRFQTLIVLRYAEDFLLALKVQCRTPSIKER